MPAAASTPRLRRSRPARPGWSAGWARSSRPGAACRSSYAWWGLVCLARDLLPHLGWLDDGRTTLGAWAYHGSGVAFATMFGRAAAARLAGREPDPPLPDFLLDAPPRFPVPGLRLQALRAAYLAYGLQDEWL